MKSQEQIAIEKLDHFIEQCQQARKEFKKSKMEMAKATSDAMAIAYKQAKEVIYEMKPFLPFYHWVPVNRMQDIQLNENQDCFILDNGKVLVARWDSMGQSFHTGHSMHHHPTHYQIIKYPKSPS